MPKDPETDETEKLLEDLVRTGDVEAEGEGESRSYRLSEKGKRYVEELLARNPAAKAFVDKIRGGRN